MAYRNKADQLAAQKRHYEKHKAAIIARNTERKNRERALLSEYIRQRKDVPCADCKQRYPHYVMEFDHLRDKSFEIARAVGEGYSLEKVIAECDKCEVVCANCHAERTHRRRAANRGSRASSCQSQGR